MADKNDQFATTVANGLPAYPQRIYQETGDKYPNGAPVMKELGVANNPQEHKDLLAESKKAPAWGENK